MIKFLEFIAVFIDSGKNNFLVYFPVVNLTPITVVTQPKTWIVFARSNAGVVDSNPTLGMDVYLRLFYLCAVLCVDSGLCDGLIPFPRSPTDYV
jgi:hypothetical protein